MIFKKEGLKVKHRSMGSSQLTPCTCHHTLSSNYTRRKTLSLTFRQLNKRVRIQNILEVVLRYHFVLLPPFTYQIFHWKWNRIYLPLVCNSPRKNSLTMHLSPLADCTSKWMAFLKLYNLALLWVRLFINTILRRYHAKLKDSLCFS